MTSDDSKPRSFGNILSRKSDLSSVAPDNAPILQQPIPVPPCLELKSTLHHSSNPNLFNLSFPLGRSKLLSGVPRYLASNLAQALQRPIPQLHRAELDHPRIQPQRLPHIVLYLARRVVSHDEVVAVGVLRLMFPRSLGETEDAPVLDAPDRAARVED